jgi:hypothetical protein
MRKRTIFNHKEHEVTPRVNLTADDTDKKGLPRVEPFTAKDAESAKESGDGTNSRQTGMRWDIWGGGG